MCVVCGAETAAGYQQVILNTQSDALDQGAYLSIGLAVKEEQTGNAFLSPPVIKKA